MMSSLFQMHLICDTISIKVEGYAIKVIRYLSDEPQLHSIRLDNLWFAASAHCGLIQAHYYYLSKKCVDLQLQSDARWLTQCP